MKNELFETIKGDFDKLWQYRSRGNTIEVMTPFSTANSNFASVFITKQADTFIISDGGWFSKNVYELLEDNSMNKPHAQKAIEYFENYYKIKTQKNETGHILYFKVTQDVKLISALVFDIASFVSHSVAYLRIPFREDDIQGRTFKRKANSFLSEIYKENIKFSQPLEDVKNVSFSAIITGKENNIYLVSYITGSTKNYFTNSIKKAASNFELADESKFFYNNMLKKIPLIDSEANGYSSEDYSNLFNLLNKRTTAQVKWENRNEIKNLVHV